MMSLGRGHQRAADGDHLLLAARHGARLLAPPLGEDREQRAHALEGGADARAVALDVGAHLEVLQHRHLGKHDAALGHVGEPAGQHLIGRGDR